MRTFLSIGSGPGMGFATAERFAREGFQIVLSARDAAKTKELADRLKAKGYKAEIRTVDTSDPSSVAALVAEVEKQHGTIDVLHYNAASMRRATLAEQPAETFNTDLAVNIGGAQAATKAAAPNMAAFVDPGSKDAEAVAELFWQPARRASARLRIASSRASRLVAFTWQLSRSLSQPAERLMDG